MSEYMNERNYSKESILPQLTNGRKSEASPPPYPTLLHVLPHPGLMSTELQAFAGAPPLQGGEVELRRERKKSEEALGSARHQCPCGKAFPTASKLDRHSVVHSGEKPYVCSECEQSFAQEASLKAHIRHKHLGWRPHRCDDCGKAFVRAEHLRAHSRTHGKDIKPPTERRRPTPDSVSPKQEVLSCNFCEGGKVFAHAWKLERHLMIHTGERPFRCPICEAAFNQNSSLKSHIRTHTGEKPYACQECGRAFTRADHLRYHIRTHNNERPFECEHCGKRFASSSGIARHRAEHKKRNNRLECSLCRARFTRMENLRAHINRVHIPKLAEHAHRPSVPSPCASSPCASSPCAPSPCAPSPCAPSPCAPSPCAPSPCAPSPCAPSPCAPSPCAPSPCAPSPCAPSPCAPSPSTSSPCAHSPAGPSPCPHCRSEGASDCRWCARGAVGGASSGAPGATGAPGVDGVRNEAIYSLLGLPCDGARAGLQVEKPTGETSSREANWTGRQGTDDRLVVSQDTKAEHDKGRNDSAQSNQRGERSGTDERGKASREAVDVQQPIFGHEVGKKSGASSQNDGAEDCTLPYGLRAVEQTAKIIAIEGLKTRGEPSRATEYFGAGSQSHGDSALGIDKNNESLIRLTGLSRAEDAWHWPAHASEEMKGRVHGIGRGGIGGSYGSSFGSDLRIPENIPGFREGDMFPILRAKHDKEGASEDKDVARRYNFAWTKPAFFPMGSEQPILHSQKEYPMKDQFEKFFSFNS